MKKILIFLLIIFFPMIFFYTTVDAQKSGVSSKNSFTQYYSVKFGGDGLAKVFARIIFINNSSEIQENLRLLLPEVKIRNLEVYMQEREGRCTGYGYPKMSLEEIPYYCDRANPELEEKTCVSTVIDGYPCVFSKCIKKCFLGGVPEKISCPELTCVTSQQPDSFEDYTSQTTTGAQFELLKYNLTGNVLDIKFNPSTNPIFPMKAGSVIVSFQTPDFTRKDIFGKYDYFISTFGLDGEVINTRIGISREKGYLFKETGKETDFWDQENIFSLKTLGGKYQFIGQDKNLDDFVGRIGEGEQEIQLDGSSLSKKNIVRGSYADAKYKFYLIPILTFIFVFIGMAALISLIVISIRSYRKPEKKK